jgi:hypothetical protein
MAKQVWIKRIYYDKPTQPRTLVRSDYILQEKKVAEEIVKNTHDGRERAIYFEYAEAYVSVYKNTIRFFKSKGARWFLGAVVLTLLYFIGQYIYDRYVK